MGLVNIPVIFIFYYVIYPSWIMAIGYYLTIGLTGLAAYKLLAHYKNFVIKGKVNKTDLTGILKKREQLAETISNVVPEL